MERSIWDSYRGFPSGLLKVLEPDQDVPIDVKGWETMTCRVDALQYKDYILTQLFTKYVSDKAKSDPNSLIDIPPGASTTVFKRLKIVR